MSSEAELYILLANNLLDGPNFDIANLFSMEGRRGQALSNGERRTASSHGVAALLFMMDAEQWGFTSFYIILFPDYFGKDRTFPCSLVRFFSRGSHAPWQVSISLARNRLESKTKRSYFTLKHLGLNTFRPQSTGMSSSLQELTTEENISSMGTIK